MSKTVPEKVEISEKWDSEDRGRPRKGENLRKEGERR